MAESPDPLDDPGQSPARRRRLLEEELSRSRDALAQTRSGRVTFAFAPGGAVLPADPRARVDPGVVNERTWLLTAAAVGALVGAGGGELAAGGERHLLLHAPGADAELAALGFEENAAGIDRVKPRALVLPELPEGEALPILNPELVVAERVARRGGNPADADAVEALAEALPHAAAARPHEDPDPARRAARRILQRLNGMGKWGGYHTAFDHVARGFAGNERALANAVGEALLAAGLLASKPSVGQRHVFLNPRRAADVHRMIETGEAPPDLALPA